MSKVPKNTDKELLRQLAEPRRDYQPVSAVFRLRPASKAALTLPPEESELVTKKVLDRVTEKLGEGPEKYHVFPNLGAFAVSATPSFLRELLKQPEIISAMANHSGEDPLIRPVEINPAPKKRKR